MGLNTAHEHETHEENGAVDRPFVHSEPVVQKEKVANVITPVKGGAYLPEYLVMLILLAVILSAVATLIGIGIHSLVPQGAVSNEYNYGYDPVSIQLGWSLSAALAATPLFVWLFLRTRKVEALVPAVKQHRWRKAFLGIFLVAQTLVIVGVLADMLYKLIAPLFGGDATGGTMINYLLTSVGTTDSPWWEAVITSLITIIILGFTVYMLSDDYRSEE